MYLTKFAVRDVKCFSNVTLDFPHKEDDYAGWNVVLGGNANGKTTLLQAMAATMLPPRKADRLVDNWDDWVRASSSHGTLSSWFLRGSHDDIGAPRSRKVSQLEAELALTGAQRVEIKGKKIDSPGLTPTNDGLTQKRLRKGLYSPDRRGWLCCGYGPFRRLTGGETSSAATALWDSKRGYDFATLFYEGVALTDCTTWLAELYNLSNDPKREDRERIDNSLQMIKRVVNALLPGDVKIDEIYADRVEFRVSGGIAVDALRLSDGYRSFLALAVDLLRKIYLSVEDFSELVESTDDAVRILMDGVVLIDEADAHLHPLWQRELGFLLTRFFPRMQFIVTTHSPFLAQAATDNGLFVLRQAPGESHVSVVKPLESVRGWRIDQIVTSPLFGLVTTRDEETAKLIEKHTNLSAKREWGKLTAAESRELNRLERQLTDRLPAPGNTAEERRQHAAVAEFANRKIKELE